MAKQVVSTPVLSPPVQFVQFNLLHLRQAALEYAQRVVPNLPVSLTLDDVKFETENDSYAETREVNGFKLQWEVKDT